MTSNRDTSTVIIAVVIAGSTTRCDVKGGRGGEVRYAGVPRFGFAQCASAERGDFTTALVAAQDSRNACERTVRLALRSSLLHRRARATSSRELEDSRELRSGPTFTPQPAVEAQERRGRFSSRIVVPLTRFRGAPACRASTPSWRFTTRTARALGAMSTLAMRCVTSRRRPVRPQTSPSPPSSPATSSCASSPRRISMRRASRDPRWRPSSSIPAGPGGFLR